MSVRYYLMKCYKSNNDEFCIKAHNTYDDEHYMVKDFKDLKYLASALDDTLSIDIEALKNWKFEVETVDGDDLYNVREYLPKAIEEYKQAQIGNPFNFIYTVYRIQNLSLDHIIALSLLMTDKQYWDKLDDCIAAIELNQYDVISGDRRNVNFPIAIYDSKNDKTLILKYLIPS